MAGGSELHTRNPITPGPNPTMQENDRFSSTENLVMDNGIILDDASKGAMVLGELAQASDLSVTVKRGSREVLIQHSF